jgi:hypothetical protein
MRTLRYCRVFLAIFSPFTMLCQYKTLYERFSIRKEVQRQTGRLKKRISFFQTALAAQSVRHYHDIAPQT